MRNTIAINSLLALIYICPLCVFAQSEDFIDHFDDNRMTWSFPMSKKVQTRFEAGSLVLKSQYKQEGYFVLRPIQRILARDFDMEIAIRQVGGAKNMAYGLCWGSNKSHSDFSGFFISSNGQYTILNCQSNFFQEVKRWTESKSIVGQRKVNIMRVSRRGRKYEYYLNDQLVFVSHVKSMSGKEAGIVLYGKMQVEIDYFKVTYPDENFEAQMSEMIQND